MPDSLAVDTHTATGELPWRRAREGLAFKLLRSCLESDTWAVIFRQEPDSSVPPHIHQDHGKYVVIRGSIEFGKNADTVGVTALAGDYGVESSGVYHEQTFSPLRPASVHPLRRDPLSRFRRAGRAGHGRAKHQQTLGTSAVDRRRIGLAGTPR